MHADVAVIGAGVMGCSIALELRRGGHDVVVVDKLGSPGHGSTSASSAVVRFNFSSWAGVAAAWESRHAWEKWAEHVEAPADAQVARYVRSGLAMLDVDVAPRGTYLPLFDRAGVPYEEWDAATLAARVPYLDVGRYWPPSRLSDDRFWRDAETGLGAVFTPDAGFVSDPQQAAQDLASAAQRRGARFLMRRRVTGVRTSGGRVRGLELDGSGELAAPVVVNAAGPWSTRVNELAGVGAEFTVGLRALRQEVHHIRAPHGMVADGGTGITIADMDLGTYLRPEVGGGLLVGGTEPECDPLTWVEDPDDVAPRVTKAAFDTQVTRAARRLPGLAVPERPSGVVGVYDVSDDWTPVYDRTDLDGWYVAIGTSGNQFKNAPLVGEMVRCLVEAVENGADHDRAPLSFTARRTGLSIDLRAYSRRRPPAANSGTVMG